MAKAVNIIIDFSIPTQPTFVEVENDSGLSVKVGTWLKGKNYMKLRITSEDIENQQAAEHLAGHKEA